MAYSKKSDRQLLFHKALAERGPVRITVDSDPRYLKTKDAYVIDLTVGGADKVGYWAENEACKAFFEGQKGRTFTIIAEGSRNSATITYVGEQAPASGTLPPPPPANRPPPPPPQAPAPQQSAAAPTSHAAPAHRNGRDAVDKLRGAMVAAGQVGVALQLAAEQCLRAAAGFYHQNTGAKLEGDLLKGLVNHITETLCDGETIRSALISLDRMQALGGFPAKMTAEMVEQVKARSKAAQAAAAAKREAAEAQAKAAAAAAEAARAAAAKAEVPADKPEPEDDDVNY